MFFWIFPLPPFPDHLGTNRRSNSDQPPSPYSWNREIIQWQIISSFPIDLKSTEKINFAVFDILTCITKGESKARNNNKKNKANPLQTQTLYMRTGENFFNMMTTENKIKKVHHNKRRALQTTKGRSECDIDCEIWNRVYHPVYDGSPYAWSEVVRKSEGRFLCNDIANLRVISNYSGVCWSWCFRLIEQMLLMLPLPAFPRGRVEKKVWFLWSALTPS